jgi:6-phosphogluconolactonase (cycloisomerase 2 family)
MVRIIIVLSLFACGCNLDDTQTSPSSGSNNNDIPNNNDVPDTAGQGDMADLGEDVAQDLAPTPCEACVDGEVCFEEACCSPTLPETCAADACGVVDDGCGQTVDCGVCPPQPVALYVTRNSTGSANVLLFDIRGDGALSPMSTPSIATGTGNAVEVVIGPDNLHAYVGAGNNGSRAIHAFDIDSTTNALSLSPYPQLDSGGGLHQRDSIAMDPDGRFVYLADQGPDRRATFTFEIVEATQPGRLTQVAENRDYNTPRKVVVEPQGRFVYMLDGSSAINVLQVGTDGSLSGLPSYRIGFNPREMAVDPLGEYLYVIGGSNQLGVYRINQTSGELTFITGPNNTEFFQTANSPQKVVVDALGRYVWVVSQNTVYGHTIRRDLGGIVEELDQDPNPNDFTGFAMNSLKNLASDPSGRFLFAVGASTTHTLTVGADGKLTETLPSAAGGGDNVAVLSRVP